MFGTKYPSEYLINKIMRQTSHELVLYNTWAIQKILSDSSSHHTLTV